MDLRALQCFTVVAEERGVSAAARRLGLSQPAVSMQLHRVEARLGPLFVRAGTGLAPTEAAARLYREAAAVLRLAAAIDDRRPEAAVQLAASAASPLGMAVRRADADAPFRLALHPAEEAGAPAGPVRLRLCHGLAGDPRALCGDDWLLVTAGDDRTGLALPLLPDEIVAAVAAALDHQAAPPPRVHDLECSELLFEMIRRDRGRALLPKAAAHAGLLRHSRLTVAPASGLPPLAVLAEGDRDLAEAVRACLGGAAPPPPPLPNFRRLSYFLRTVEAGGVTRAAATLNLAQPALTAQIHALERATGAPLFVRSGRGMAPTPAGQALAAACAPLADALAALPRRVVTAQPPQDVLRIGLLPALDEESLLAQAAMAAIAAWRRSFPDVELKVVEAYSGELLSWLDQGRISVAVVEHLPERSTLATRLLSREPLALLTAPGAARGPIRLAALQDFDLVLPSSRHGLRMLVNKHLAQAGMALTPKLELDSMAMAVRLVKGGSWATILPASAARRSIAAGLIEAHPIIEPTIARELRAARRKRHRLARYERAFIEVLAAALRRDDGP